MAKISTTAWLAALLIGTPALAVQAQIPAPNGVGQEFQFDNFWVQALPLLQAQLDLAARLQAVLANPDADRLEVARADLGDRLRESERFLRDQYRAPAQLCLDLDNPPVTSLTPAQQRAYCTLYQTWQRQQAIAASLRQPVPPTPTSLLSVAPTSPRLSPDSLLFDPEPVIAPSVPLPAIPMPRPRVISQPAKLTQDVGILPPAQDAEAAQPLTLLAAIRQEILALQSLLPAGETLNDPLGGAAEAQEETITAYRDFLAQPNTGFARLQPTSRTADFAALPSRQPSYAPLLALTLEGETVAIAPNPLRYGFLADLGERRLDGRSLPARRRDYAFFWDYQPPPQLAQIQAHQRAFVFDKLGVGTEYPAAPPFPGRVPLELGHAYLLRLVQYQLPDVILNNEPIPSERRRYASAILAMNSSDLLLAVQPIARHPDGSVTILWQLVQQFPDPPVTDLDRYVQFK
ncbi:MAG: hypothetical protein HC910_17050 [Spirulinaceae cyanobacterium SM2_1_0]|nr:hypothetical protein [Spirulinaceae cyanobacterium SM2_1_0]